jgi:hypothetical protein
MIVNLCPVIENIAPSAIGAVGFTRLTDWQIDHGMAQRTAAAVASDSRRFYVNDLGWLHLIRLIPSKGPGLKLSPKRSKARLD